MDSFEQVNAARRTTALAITIGLHVLLAVGLILGTNRVVVDRIFGPVETEIIEEVQDDADEPPPPPPVVETPPPYVPPPDIVIDVPTSTGPTTAITAVTNTPRPAAPPPPPQEVVRVAPKPDPRLMKSGRWKPEMPPSVQREARKVGDLGATLLRCVVNAEGRCESVSVLQPSPIPRLDEAAVKHAQRVWKFTPATENGKPVTFNYDSRIVWRVTD